MSSPPAEFTIQGDEERTVETIQYQLVSCVKRLEVNLADAQNSLEPRQAIYKRDFYRSIRKENCNSEPRDFVYIYPEQGCGKKMFGGYAIGPFAVLRGDARTFLSKEDPWWR